MTKKDSTARRPSKLTEAWIKGAKVKTRTNVVDAACPGLQLRITPKGVKTWAVAYRDGARKVTHTIGRWPAVTLKAAREEARRIQAAVSPRMEHDPE